MSKTYMACQNHRDRGKLQVPELVLTVSGSQVTVDADQKQVEDQLSVSVDTRG